MRCSSASLNAPRQLRRQWRPALLDERRTAPRDIYDLELLLSRGVCPSPEVVEQFGDLEELTQRVSTKLDLMGWALFRDQVLLTLPRETQANIDEEEYLAMKVRLLEASEHCLLRQPNSDAAMKAPHWTTRLELALEDRDATNPVLGHSVGRYAL